MTTYYRSRAVVIRAVPSGESDWSLTIYTEIFGRVDLVARGVRHEKSKLRGHVVPFTLASVMFIGSKNGYALVDAIGEKQRLIATHEEAQAMRRMGNFLLSVVVGTEPDPALWALIVSIFIDDAESVDWSRTIIEWKSRILETLGMAPVGALHSEETVQEALRENHML